MAELTPVIIAARNEEAVIDIALASFDYTTVEPIVIVNGSSDGTADVARNYPVIVIESALPGKLQAIQTGLNFLGDRALGPVLYTDADTRPLFPKQWARSMIASLGVDNQIVSGLAVADKDLGIVNRSLMSVLRIVSTAESQVRGTGHAAGYNMATHFRTYDMLEKVLNFEHRGSGEDVMLAKLIAGPGRKPVTFKPTAIVRTSSRYKPTPVQAIRMGTKRTREIVELQRHDRFDHPITV